VISARTGGEGGLERCGIRRGVLSRAQGRIGDGENGEVGVLGDPVDADEIEPTDASRAIGRGELAVEARVEPQRDATVAHGRAERIHAQQRLGPRRRVPLDRCQAAGHHADDRPVVSADERLAVDVDDERQVGQG
jgi:hypothetical protein